MPDVITAIPDLLRIVSPYAADDDWEALQTVPDDASIIVDVPGATPVAQVSVMAIAKMNNGDVVAGTVDLQLIEIATATDSRALDDGAPHTIVIGSAIEAALPTGRLSVLPGSHLRRFTVRLVGASAEVQAADLIKIYWRAS